jgi:hypothetical protein
MLVSGFEMLHRYVIFICVFKPSNALNCVYVAWFSVLKRNTVGK